jgi:hypothetical protein
MRNACRSRLRAETTTTTVTRTESVVGVRILMPKSIAHCTKVTFCSVLPWFDLTAHFEQQS